MDVDEVLEYAEKHWDKEQFYRLSRGLRDIHLRQDKKRELSHSICAGKTSAQVGLTFGEGTDIEFSLHTSSIDTTDVPKYISTSASFCLSKEELKKLTAFLYYATSGPDE